MKEEDAEEGRQKEYAAAAHECGRAPVADRKSRYENDEDGQEKQGEIKEQGRGLLDEPVQVVESSVLYED